MKIMLLTTRLPKSHVGGDMVRLHAICNELAKNHELTVVGLLDHRITNDELQVKSTPIFNEISFRLSKGRRLYNLLYSFVTNKAITVGYFHSREVQNWVKVNRGNYDRVICYHARSVQYLSNNFTDTSVDFVDLISENYTKQALYTKSIIKYLYRREAERYRSLEKEIVQKANAVTLISVEELELLNKQWTNLNARLLVNPVNVQKLNELARENCSYDFSCSRYLVFFGKMTYRPNIDAIDWFVKDCYSVLEKLDLNLVVLGLGSEPLIKKYSNKKRLYFTGYVANPYVIINNSDFVIAPMLTGAGVQNKVLESLAIGKTVLASNYCAKGLVKPLDEAIELSELHNFSKNLEALYCRITSINYNQKAVSYIERNYSNHKFKKQLKLLL